ncbi:hypothetical protein L208DRAFT_1111090, partial [Tricholoma matsutake]
EDKIQAAVKDVKNGTYCSAAAAAWAHDLGSQYMTIWCCINGLAASWCKAHLCQQLLNAGQEKVLMDWVKFLALSGMPLSKCTLAPKVFTLCGKTPSHKWVYHFLHQH